MVPSLLSLLRKSTSEECQMLDYPAFRSCLFVFPCVEEEPVFNKKIPENCSRPFDYGSANWFWLDSIFWNRKAGRKLRNHSWLYGLVRLFG